MDEHSTKPKRDQLGLRGGWVVVSDKVARLANEPRVRDSRLDLSLVSTGCWVTQGSTGSGVLLDANELSGLGMLAHEAAEGRFSTDEELLARIADTLQTPEGRPRDALSLQTEVREMLGSILAEVQPKGEREAWTRMCVASALNMATFAAQWLRSEWKTGKESAEALKISVDGGSWNDFEAGRLVGEGS